MNLPIIRNWRSILIGLLFSACVKPSAPVPVQPFAWEPADGPAILFINYKITAPDTSRATDYEQVICLNHFLTPGTLKTALEPPSSVAHAQYACLMQNERKEILKKIELENPLIRTFEYVTEDHNLVQKELKTGESEFSIRTQLPPETRYVIFVKYISASDTTILNTLDLQRL